MSWKTNSSCWLLDGEIVVPSSRMHAGRGTSSFSLEPEAHGLNPQHCQHSCLEWMLCAAGGSPEGQQGLGVQAAQQCCGCGW